MHGVFRNAHDSRPCFKGTLHFKSKNVSFCLSGAFLTLGHLKL